MQMLERYDPEWAVPQCKAFAAMIEKLNGCERDSERVRLLVKHVLGDSECLSSWSLWWLEPATFRLKVPNSGAKNYLESEKKSKVTIASQAVERVAKHAVSASDFYNVACCFSLFVRSAVEESDQELNALRADEFLKLAIEKGWDDVERFKNDTDLEPVRARDDFKKLLAKLETRKATQPSKMK